MVFSAHNMRIILCKAPHSSQTTKLTFLFKSINGSSFTSAKRKMSITFGFCFVNLYMERTVHGFEEVLFRICFTHLFPSFLVFQSLSSFHWRIHAIRIKSPVSRNFPKFFVPNMWSSDKFISVFSMSFISKIFDSSKKPCSFWQPKRQSKTYIFRKSKKSKLFSKHSMISFFGFFHHIRIFSQFIFWIKSSCIYSSHHYIIFVSSPIGSS